MLHVCVRANACGTPGIDIESLPTRQVTLAYLFRSTRDELEALAITSVAVVLQAAIL